MTRSIICAGDLRQLINIQRPGPIDGNGQPNPEWLAELFDVPARIEQLAGIETGPDKFWDPRAGNTQLIPTETHRVTIRYLDGLDATRRIVWQGRVLKILSVSDYNSRNIYMVIPCEERVRVTDAGAPYAPPPLSSYTGSSGPRRATITGTRNGVNVNFTVPGNPDPAVLMIVWNGSQMGPGSYTLGTFSGGITPLTTAFAPGPSDDFYAMF